MANIFKRNKKVRNVYFIGDESVGKSCFLTVLKEETFPKDFIPVTLDSFQLNSNIEESSMLVSFHDTDKIDKNELISEIRKSGFDIIVLCYAINDRKSFISLKDEWIPLFFQNEIADNLILIGLKQELRNNFENTNNPVELCEGMNFALEINAFDFIECSAKQNYNIKEVFAIIERVLLLVEEKKEHKPWYFWFFPCCN